MYSIVASTGSVPRRVSFEISVGLQNPLTRPIPPSVLMVRAEDRRLVKSHSFDTKQIFTFDGTRMRSRTAARNCAYKRYVRPMIEFTAPCIRVFRESCRDIEHSRLETLNAPGSEHTMRFFSFRHNVRLVFNCCC